MRAKALKFNMLAGWLSEIFALISGLILPRLMITTFGSATNGMVSSIAQFLGFTVILRAGLGAVTRAALYKPLAEKDEAAISGIMSATQSYMRKVAMIILGYILTVAVVYPLFAKGDFSYMTMFSMVLIVGSVTFADNFFGIKAKILLQAAQKYYVETLCHLASSIVAFAVSVLLITINCDVLIVKIGAALAAFINPLLLNLYIRKKFNLNIKAKPNNNAIKQRWDAFAQQMAVVVNQNVDLVLLTLFVELKEISVYTVHSMITINIKKVVTSMVTGINSTFGDMIAKDEKENLKTVFLFIEWALFAACTILFSVTAIMIVPFISIYTESVTDVNYIRPFFAFAITTVALIDCMRIPYQMITEAAGHFKQTRNGAILEVILNIVASLVLLWLFGIVGVIIGTFIAGFVRTSQYAMHALKNVLHISPWHLVRSYGIYFITFIGLYFGFSFIEFKADTNFLNWVLSAIIVTVICVVVVSIISLINNKSQVKYLKNKLIRKNNGAKK